MSAPLLLRWLTLIALFLAPLAMIGAAPAMGHDRVAEAGPCADMGIPGEAPLSAPVDCMIACAGLPAQAMTAAHPALIPAAPEPPASAAHFSGVGPQAAIPPPRIT